MNLIKTSPFSTISRVILIAATLTYGSQVFAGAYAYVPNEKDGTVSVIDTATDTVVNTLPKKGAFGKKIQAVAMDPDGKKLYVVVRDKNAVAMVDLAKGKQERLIKVGDEPEGLSLIHILRTMRICGQKDNRIWICS